MQVHLVDPSADVLPYDNALAAALARKGAQVELVTSRFVHGPRPPRTDSRSASPSTGRLRAWGRAEPRCGAR